jgi:penicillin amidase
MTTQYRYPGYGGRVRLMRMMGRLPDPAPLTSRTVPGLQPPVRIGRDAWHEPVVEADSEHDLYFAQGYLHAGDRFFQMDLSRRMPAGRLAALLGPGALELDRFYRRLNVPRAAVRALAGMEDPERDALRAYADGVNAALHDGVVPPEHRLLRSDPEPWKPEDSLYAAYQLAWALNNIWALKWALASTTDDPAAQELLAGMTRDVPAVLGGAGTSAGGSGIGSNNWVVGGRRTVSGAPLLANDPHLMGTLPSVWYPLRLLGPGVDVAGLSLAGAPGVIIGQNADIAWGVTNVDPDVQDVVRITPDAAGESYLTLRGPARLTSRSETIFVRGGKPESLRCWETDLGPVIRELPGGDMLVLRWNALREPPPLRAVYLLNRARDWDDFEHALAFWHAPAQHFVYGDRAGHIGYRLGGQVFRASDRPIVLDARRDDLTLPEVMPFEERPHVLDPDDAILVTANNPPTDAAAPNRVDGAYTLGTRARRIRRCLETTAAHTAQTFAALQADVFSPPLQDFAGKLLAHPGLPDSWRGILAGFDGQVTADSVAVTHLHLLAEALLPEHTREVLLRPFFPDHPPGPPGSHPFPERFMDLVGERLVPWVTANLDRLDLPAAITAAERTGERAFGAHRAEWTWGRAHRLRLFHPFIQVPFLDPVFGRLEVGLGGDHTTPNQTAYPVGPHLPWPRQVSYLPSMRAVFDLADRQRSAVVHLTGSSGHPLSAHYDDMLPLYLENRRVPLGPGMEVREHIELTPDVRQSDGMEPERPGALSDGS